MSDVAVRSLFLGGALAFALNGAVQPVKAQEVTVLLRQAKHTQDSIASQAQADITGPMGTFIDALSQIEDILKVPPGQRDLDALQTNVDRFTSAAVAIGQAEAKFFNHTMQTLASVGKDFTSQQEGLQTSIDDAYRSVAKDQDDQVRIGNELTALEAIGGPNCDLTVANDPGCSPGVLEKRNELEVESKQAAAMEAIHAEAANAYRSHLAFFDSATDGVRRLRREMETERRTMGGLQQQLAAKLEVFQTTSRLAKTEEDWGGYARAAAAMTEKLKQLSTAILSMPSLTVTGTGTVEISEAIDHAAEIKNIQARQEEAEQKLRSGNRR